MKAADSLKGTNWVSHCSVQCTAVGPPFRVGKSHYFEIPYFIMALFFVTIILLPPPPLLVIIKINNNNNFLCEHILTMMPVKIMIISRIMFNLKMSLQKLHQHCFFLSFVLFFFFKEAQLLWSTLCEDSEWLSVPGQDAERRAWCRHNQGPVPSYWVELINYSMEMR